MLKDPYQKYIYISKYSRWLETEKRRETWDESCDRYLDFLFNHAKQYGDIPEKVRKKCDYNLRNQNAAGSMRLFWTAGPAAIQDPASAYNCSGTVVDDLAAFAETAYLLMCGCGVGFSVENQYIKNLPVVHHQAKKPVCTHFIQDSKYGWKEAIELGMSYWFDGWDISFDSRLIRPRGTRLKTMGGRASGPEVLIRLLSYMREIILGAQGRRLTSLEIHDLLCEIATVVMSGGVRRSALISLSDLGDLALRDAKHPPFPDRRKYANNSAIYHYKPDVLDFLQEFLALAQSKTGERGIANIWAAKRNAPGRRKKGPLAVMNPCGEVVLRPNEFCNVSSVIIRQGDTFDIIRDKVSTAIWLGVMQSTLTDFKALRPEWKENCEEERLCGVSLAGQFDNISLLSEDVLELLKQHAINTAKKAAKILGIKTPAAVTCIKPEGTLSQLVNASPGMHPRWSAYYIRRVLINTTDPLFSLMVDQGVEAKLTPDDPTTAVIEFPVESPKGAITRKDITALDQLAHYEKVVTKYCEHNASCSVYVRPDEWLRVAAWVYDHFDIVNGISFFPFQDHAYELAPFEEITEFEYQQRAKKFPQLDYDQLYKYETDDQTTGAREVACAGGVCEL